MGAGFGNQVMEDDQLWNIEDVATFLRMSVSGVRELCRTRSQARMTTPLPVLKIHNKCVRFKRSDVIQWVNGLGAA